MAVERRRLVRQNLLAPQRVEETPLLPCGGGRCGGMPTRNATCAPTPSTNCRRVEEPRCGDNRHELAGRAVQHRHARYQRRKANLRPLGAPARRGRAWRGRWSTPSPLPPFLVTPCNTCPRVVCISTFPNCACRNIRSTGNGAGVCRQLDVEECAVESVAAHGGGGGGEARGSGLLSGLAHAFIN